MIHQLRSHLALVLLFLIAADAVPQGPQSPILFKVLAGPDNGSLSILDERHAEVKEKKGGKLSGHDWWLWGLTSIDYDRDGDPDFMVTIHGPAGHGVFLKNLFKETGKLAFADVTRELGVDWQLPSAEGRRTFVWDFDGDGWLDFSGLHTPDFLNQQGKKFIPTAKKAFGSFSPQEIVDLNGDGHPDVYNAAGSNALWDPKTRTFKLQPFTHPLKDKMPAGVSSLWTDAKDNPKNRFLRVHFITDHDLDGDGVNEVVVTGYGSYGGDAFGRYLKPLAAKRPEVPFVDATKQMGLPQTGTPILFRDLDGDGHVDVLVAASPEAGFYRNDGKGRFRIQSGPLTDLLRSRDPYLHRADAADFDNDGLLDLVVSKPRSGPKVIFANLGGGVFETLHKAQGWDSDPVVVCDLNDDGLLDVAIGGPGNQVTLFLNATAKPGHAARLYPRLPAPNVNAVGTRVEVFRRGELAKPGARPFLVEKAHPDATPIHAGLGKETRFDVRVVFPGHAPLVLTDVEAAKGIEITPKGVSRAK